MATATRKPNRGEVSERSDRAAETTDGKVSDRSGKAAETGNDTAAAGRQGSARSSRERQDTGRPSRRQVAAARGASAVGSGMLGIARLIRIAVGLVVLVIVAAIVLRALDANASNAIVSDIHDAGRWLTTPFHNMFSFRKPKLSMAANWGVAAAVYLIVGLLIARLIARAAPRPAIPATA